MKSMNTKTKTEISLELYYTSCNDLLRLYCQKHGYDFSRAKDNWVAGDIGGVTCLDEITEFISMADIVTDLRLNAPSREHERFTDYLLDCHNYDLPEGLSYESWLRGAPRYTPEQIRRAKESKEAIDRLKEQFRKDIQEYEQNKQTPQSK